MRIGVRRLENEEALEGQVEEFEQEAAEQKKEQ